MHNSKKLNICVIGSGLSSIGAIRGLIEKGFKPTIIDFGDEIDKEKSLLVSNLSKKLPSEWSKDELRSIAYNPTINSKNSIPKKLLFGSDYFYGKSKINFPVSADDDIPPLSYAMGGLSCGWGAAILPPSDCDLEDWPIKISELNNCHSKILETLPYSAQDDGLSKSFKIFKKNPIPLKLSKSAKMLKKSLDKSDLNKKKNILYGQARLLIDSNKCNYYGYSMSGCVYGSIYQSSIEIKKKIKEEKIIYKKNCLVDKVEEINQQVIVHFYNENGELKKDFFDRVFIAAGATNSSRIVMNSIGMFNHKVKLKTRGGYIVPMFSFRKLPSDWPNCNTHPELFIELKNKILKNWVHIQISPENELIRQKLNLENTKNRFIKNIKKFIINHTFIAFINFHSNYGGHYEISIKEENNKNYSNRLVTKHIIKNAPIKIILNTFFNLTLIFLKTGSIPIYFLAKLNNSSYHIGGTMPMKEKRKEMLDTDELGRISKWKRIHIIDSSIFPSLPGTTIGLLLISNAYRIIMNVFNNKKND